VTYYLDHNACTPVDPRVLERFLETERRHAANPASLHASGRAARVVIERSRDRVAAILNASPEQVIFVSGGTEANNQAVAGLGDLTQPVLLAPLEHPSVMGQAENRGAVWWSVDNSGRAVVVDPERAIGLVCLVHAQNEVGTIQPIADAARVAQQHGAPLHVDISQSLGRIAVDEPIAVADSVTLSPHKVGGLRGMAVLLVRDPNRLRSLILGGNQEHGLRPGTVSPSLVAANALAVELAVDEQPERSRAMNAARTRFEAVLGSSAPCQILGGDDRLPNTVMVLFESVDGRNLLPALDLAGVEVSQGSACTTGSPEPPKILTAMGLSAEDAQRCVRFSFDWRMRPEDAERVAQATGAAVSGLRSSDARG